MVWLTKCRNSKLNQSYRASLFTKFKTEDRLRQAGHETGPQCKCVECGKLKRIEDKWIFKMGTFYGDIGLNTRDEITAAKVYFVNCVFLGKSEQPNMRSNHRK